MSTPTPRRLTRALIVDDHPLFCDALALTLRGTSTVAEVESVHTLADALTRLERAPMIDLVLLDLDLPDVDGLDGMLRLRAQAPEMPVVIVSSMADARLIRSALGGGARAFVPKHAGRDVFRTALGAVALGQTWMPQDIDPGSDADQQAVARLSELTRQQAKILDLLCQGRLNKQIAWELSIAETTVKAHVTAIMRKLGVQSRTQAVLMAQQAKFTAFLPEG